MLRDFTMVGNVLPTIPKEQRTRGAHFLEKQGFKQQALTVSTDPEHCFELALPLGKLKIAYQLAVEAELEQKWKPHAELAVSICQFSLAQACLHHVQDYRGLLLLALASGNTSMVNKLADGTKRDGKNNVAFMSYILQANQYRFVTPSEERNVMEEAKGFQASRGQQERKPASSPVIMASQTTQKEENGLLKLEVNLHNLELDDIDTTDINLAEDILMTEHRLPFTSKTKRDKLITLVTGTMEIP
ncbi:Coatomer subunit beta [Sigmodon hispidus]